MLGYALVTVLRESCFWILEQHQKPDDEHSQAVTGTSSFSAAAQGFIDAT